MAMKITAQKAKQTAQEVNTRRAEERKQKTLEHLNGPITEQILSAMNNGETYIIVRTNKELDWELIKAELRKEENGFAVACTSGHMRIGW